MLAWRGGFLPMVMCRASNYVHKKQIRSRFSKQAASTAIAWKRQWKQRETDQSGAARLWKPTGEAGRGRAGKRWRNARAFSHTETNNGNAGPSLQFVHRHTCARVLRSI